MVEPDRDVRGFQSVLLDLGARLGLPGMVAEDGSPKFKDYADYIQNHIQRYFLHNPLFLGRYKVVFFELIL